MQSLSSPIAAPSASTTAGGVPRGFNNYPQSKTPRATPSPPNSWPTFYASPHAHTREGARRRTEPPGSPIDGGRCIAGPVTENRHHAPRLPLEQPNAAAAHDALRMAETLAPRLTRPATF